MTDQEMTPDKETPFKNLDAWIFWKEKELERSPDEGEQQWFDDIKALRSENEKLKEENEGNQVWIGRLEKDLEEQCLLLGKSGSREAQLLTRIRELEEALKKIANIEHGCVGHDSHEEADQCRGCVPTTEATDIAKNTLSKTKPSEENHKPAHMCQDDHIQIRHNDSESEMCPLRVEKNKAKEWKLWAERLANYIEHPTIFLSGEPGGNGLLSGFKKFKEGQKPEPQVIFPNGSLPSNSQGNSTVCCFSCGSPYPWHQQFCTREK